MTLKAWGWDDWWAQRAEQEGVDTSSVARVVGQDRASWSVQTELGPETARFPSASSFHSPPVVGDWIIVEPGPMLSDPWSILAMLPRRSMISRGAAGTGGGEQVLASNVDKVWIVHGLDLAFNPRRLERYLAVVWESGATPEVILTKGDLAEDLEATVTQVQQVGMGTPIRRVSSEDSESLQDLRSTLVPGAPWSPVVRSHSSGLQESENRHSSIYLRKRHSLRSGKSAQVTGKGATRRPAGSCSGFQVGHFFLTHRASESSGSG